MKRKSLLFFLLIALLAPLAMNAQTTLLSQNFDGTGFTISNNTYDSRAWYTYKANNGLNWQLEQSSTYAHSGSYSMMYSYSDDYAANCYLVSEPFNVSSSMTQLSVSLYERVRSGSWTETFEVFFVKASDVTTLAGVASATHYNAITSANYTNTDYAQVSGSVASSALKGQSVRVVVHCTSAAGQWNLYIDDITVTETTGTVSTYSVTYNANGGTGTMTDPNSPYTSGSTVTVMSNTFTAPSDMTFSGWNTAANGSGTSYAPGDHFSISANTTLYAQWVAPCDYSEDFENVSGASSGYSSAGSLPTGWDQIYGGTVNSTTAQAPHVHNGASYPGPGTGTNALSGYYLGFYGTGNGSVCYAIMPALPANEAANHISFKYRYESTNNGTISYGVIDGTDASTYVQIGTCSKSTSNGLVDVALNVSQTAGKRIAFCWNYSGSSWYTAAIDDICVMTESTSNCSTPTGLTVNNITNNSASVAWNAENGVDYEVEYAEITASTPLINGSWLQYDNGTNISSIGNGSTQYDWTWGVMYPASMLNGKTVLSKISIYEDATYNTGDITIDIYSGGTNEPATLIYTETITPQPNDAFQEIQLSTPVAIDPTQNLWIALTEYGYYVMPYCSSSETNNQWVENDGWMNITDLSSNFSGYGWMIRGFIQEIDFSNLTGWQSLSSPYDMTELNAETQYAVRVRANCGEDGESSWANTSFITLSNCATPYNLTSANTTANSATLNWLGAQEEYDVNIKKVLFFEDFEGGAIPSGWTTFSNSNDSYNWYYDNSYSHSHSGSGVMSSASSVSNGTSWNDFTPDHWLVTPKLDLQGTMSVWVRSQQTNASYYQEHFAIYLSLTNGSSVSDFTITLVPENVTTTEYIEYTADLSQYVGQQGYIAIRHFNCNGQFRMNIDDFAIFDDIRTVTATTVPFTIDQLEPVSDYMWQVQGVDCDGNGHTTDWSEVATFTTTTQFVKHIIGYNSEEGNGSGNYYLIASPIGQVAPTNVTNMINSTHTGYDLFYFDQAQDLEWITYKPSGTVAPGFNLVSGKGYLYANSQTVDLVFNGSNGNYITNGSQTISLDYVDTAPNNGTYNIDLPGWNLVGNPFAVIAFPNRSFYTMDSDGSAFVAVSSASASIEAMEGIFVEATGTGQSVTFSTTDPNAKSPTLALNLINTTTGSSHVIDRAIVRFDQGDQLHKFQLFKNSTKVYIPKDGQDYAIVCSEEIGEMPVNFKAEDNGTYTLNLSVENVEFGYLHLIDNKTGMDIDLLQTPSYTFEAKTTDYESRFKLVFATGDNSKDDNFAYFSNGSFVINNDGKATLQVIDIMGRILKSENINGCANLNVNAAPGVYMLRLVNGDNVKVQKVVVK